MANTQHEFVIEMKELEKKCNFFKNWNTFRSFVKDLGDAHTDTLTYAFSPENRISQSFKSAFVRAFGQWSEVIHVDFVEDHDFSTANIQIGFYRHRCGCGTPTSHLAHANYQDGRICLNADRKWVVDFESEKSTGGFDLESVATHEIGHVLGLGHSENPRSVMYKGIRTGQRLAICADDEIQILKLYSPRPANPVDEEFTNSSSTICKILVPSLFVCTIFTIFMVFITKHI